MSPGRPEHRHRSNRRVRFDRRTGLDRRVIERRLRATPVLVERRGPAERRGRVERRSPASRRSWIDRRGSGMKVPDVNPS